MFKRFIMFSIVGFVLTFTQVIVSAQTAIETTCGAVISSELTERNEAGNENYALDFNAGDAISVTVSPVGTAPNVFIRLYDINDTRLTTTGWGAGGGQPDSIEDFVLPATGRYRVEVGADRATAYTIEIGCLSREGVRTNPGDPSVESPGTASSNGTISMGTPPSFGFQGASPVDFMNGVTIPLNADAVNTGSISHGFDGIFGYQFTAVANQAYDLTFERTDGSLHLGLAVIAEDNTLVFQASVLTVDNLSARIITPTAGSYTIGIYRYDGAQPIDAQQAGFGLTLATASQ